MLDPRTLLGLPIAYRLLERLIGANVRAVYAREFIQARPGQRILDMGCGPGDVLAHLPDVDYLGIDRNPHYIRAARARFGGRGTFRCEAMADVVVREAATFDIVMANGVLHHLSDAEVRGLLQLARRALRPSGRLLAFDGCFLPGQSRWARTLLRFDRGQFVRTPDAYVALASELFGSVESHVRHDLLRVPYTHHIMICRPFDPEVEARTATKAGIIS